MTVKELVINYLIITSNSLTNAVLCCDCDIEHLKKCDNFNSGCEVRNLYTPKSEKELDDYLADEPFNILEFPQSSHPVDREPGHLSPLWKHDKEQK